MRRCLVIGGRGYYGARVVEQLGRLDGLEVSTAGRRGGDTTLDLADAETLHVLDGWDLIVDCADTVGAPPDAAVRRVLARGGTWLEMGADSPAVERLLALSVPDPAGAIVVGVGIFPGLSTAVAADVAARVTGPLERVDVAVRLSPLSGAGPGNVSLMTSSLETPSYRYEAGQRLEGPVLGESRAFPYARVGDQVAMHVALPDTALVRRATGAPDVASWLAVSPAWLRFNFMALTAMLRVAGPLRRPLLWLTDRLMALTRGVFLRRVSSSVQLTARARGADGSVAERRLDVPDGQLGTALGVAAAVALLLSRDAPPAPGVYTVADLFAVDDLLAEVRRLAGAASIAES